MAQCLLLPLNKPCMVCFFKIAAVSAWIPGVGCLPEGVRLLHVGKGWWGETRVKCL